MSAENIKFVGNAKERFLYHNTLLCLVKTLQGQNVTVDLRNDSYLCGYVTMVDGYMNITFSDVVFCDPRGNEFLFENLFVHARNIRYVHVPETKSILTTIKNELNKERQEPVKKQTEKSRKAKKALQRHMETVASLDT